MKTTKQEIKDFEDYKLVHNFMYPDEPLKDGINEGNFINNFRKDWNNLMEVVEKIENLNLTKGAYPEYPKVKHLGDHAEIFCYGNYKGESIYWKGYFGVDSNIYPHVNQVDSKIEATYKVVVEFIKWYNKEK